MMRISKIKLKQIGAYKDLFIDCKANTDPQNRRWILTNCWH